MSEHVNRNVQEFRSQFGDGALFPPGEGGEFEVGGVTFVCDYSPGSTADRFYIVKSASHCLQYQSLCQRFAGGAIVELGIAEGGGTALTALVAQPSKLVAVDIESMRLPALDEFVAARGLGDVVRAHYGVDQSDREALGAILDAEFGDAPIDLVIDDASHRLDLTRSSFDTVFPRVRPGGVFVIEDWNAEHLWRSLMVQALRELPPEEFRAQVAAASQAPPEPVDRPLSDLVVELMLVLAAGGDVIRSVDLQPFGAFVERGAAPLDAGFRLADLVHEDFGYLS